MRLSFISFFPARDFSNMLSSLSKCLLTFQVHPVKNSTFSGAFISPKSTNTLNIFIKNAYYIYNVPFQSVLKALPHYHQQSLLVLTLSQFTHTRAANNKTEFNTFDFFAFFQDSWEWFEPGPELNLSRPKCRPRWPSRPLASCQPRSTKKMSLSVSLSVFVRKLKF